MDDSDRRKYPRFDVNLAVKTFRANSADEISARTKDISSKGIGCVCDNGFPVGTSLDVWLYTPEGEPMHMAGSVVWLYRDDGRYRMGIELSKDELKPIPLVLRSIRSKLRNFN